MKNILIVIPTLRMGGAEKSLISLLKVLDPQRVAVDLEAGGVLQAAGLDISGMLARIYGLYEGDTL